MSSVIEQSLAHLNQAPGKRLRSQLLTASAIATGGADADPRAKSCAEAIELIHSYSLVHDDLPAMDDDDLRRGQSTLHVAFDEATAILVGDGLQARAFELIAADNMLSAEQRVELITCLSQAAGFDGMVGGQSLDMQSTGKQLTLEQLEELHTKKTGALFAAAMRMGAIIGDASPEERETLHRIGLSAGLAFQIIDDVIDVRSDSEMLGKTSGKDAAAGKTTYVSLLGIEEAEAAAERLYEESMAALSPWGERASELRELIGKMVKRNH